MNGSSRYPLAADTIGKAEIAAAKAVLDSGRLTMGARVRKFEREFAAWVGAQEAVMVNSGSSANLLMVESLIRSAHGAGVLRTGDEVLVPGLAWPTTVWPLVQLGLVPVIVDIDPNTLGLEIESAREAIGPRTRAIFLIHPLGRALDMAPYKSICTEFDLLLIEDACESLGAHWQKNHVGTIGRMGSFSFYFSHHLSTVEGGMVVTNHADLADDLRSFRAHGWIRDRSDRQSWTGEYPEFDPRFLFASSGYNVRPMEIQGAIGSVQLRRLDSMLRRREALARTVAEWLAHRAPWLQLIGRDLLPANPTQGRRDRSHSWMTLPLRLAVDAPITRQWLISHFEIKGIETRPILAGNIERHPAMRHLAHRTARSMRNSDSLLEQGLMIGCHPIVSSGGLSTLERAIESLAGL